MAQDKQTLFRRLMWLGAAVLVVIFFFVVRDLTRSRLPIRAAEAVTSDLTSTISTNGKVEPQNNFEAHAPISTSIRKIYVHEGELVTAGELLISLDDADSEARLASARTTLQTAESTLEATRQGGTTEEQLSLKSQIATALLNQQQAQRELASLQQLSAKGAASPNEVAAANQRLAVANESLQSLQQRRTGRYSTADIGRVSSAVNDARAALAAAQQVVTQSNVHAPFAGVVYSLPVSATEYVEQGKLLLQMANLSSIQVRAYFDEPEIGRLSDGQAIQIVWDAKPGREWHGHILRVPSTIITYGTRNVGEVVISVDDADGVLLPNTNVTVTVTTQQEKEVLSVPREALHSEGGKSYVFKVSGSELIRTPVVPGTINLTRAGIQSGLKKGDVVALSSRNGQPLQEGIAVRVVP